FFFFFQAEDGIRDFHVTGVQTCALPICRIGPADGPWLGQHGFGDRSRQRLGGLEAAEQRQDDEEVDEVVRRADLGEQHVDALRQIGRASCREREYIAVGGREVQKNTRGD